MLLKEALASVSAVVLASGSPRRKELLGLVLPEEYGFEVQTSDFDENLPKDTDAADYALRTATAKGESVVKARNAPDELVISADTVVVRKDKILEKPRDDDHARDMLSKLSGKTHKVITGVALFHKGRSCGFHASTKVTFPNSRRRPSTTTSRRATPWTRPAATASRGGRGVSSRVSTGAITTSSACRSTASRADFNGSWRTARGGVVFKFFRLAWFSCSGFRRLCASGFRLNALHFRRTKGAEGGRGGFEAKADTHPPKKSFPLASDSGRDSRDRGALEQGLSEG